jgi:hypothetical protein
MRTKCSYCGIESTTMEAGENCHVCLRGYMVSIENEEDEPKEWERGYFGYASYRKKNDKKRGE